MSWKRTSASAISVISLLFKIFLKSSAAFFISSISSFVILSHASCTASSSSAFLTSRTSRIFFSVISATSAPFLGIISTRPSSSSLRIASRIGVRLTPSLFASWISISLSPGFNSPRKIACLKVLNRTSLSGIYSFIFTLKFDSMLISSLHYVCLSHTPALPIAFLLSLLLLFLLSLCCHKFQKRSAHCHSS